MATLLFSLGLVFTAVAILAGLWKDYQPKPVFVAAPFMLFMAAAVAKYLGL